MTAAQLAATLVGAVGGLIFLSSLNRGALPRRREFRRLLVFGRRTRSGLPRQARPEPIHELTPAHPPFSARLRARVVIVGVGLGLAMANARTLHEAAEEYTRHGTGLITSTWNPPRTSHRGLRVQTSGQLP